MNVKLVNFENAESLVGLSVEAKVGSGCYQAPESLSKNVVDGHKADVFSAGVILFMLV